MSKILKYSVLIIGLGNIGMRYDYDNYSEEIILTHAKSFYINDNFNLIGGVDLKEKNLNEFKKKYKCNGFSDIKEAMINLYPDIVIISSPTNKHFENIKEVFKYHNPKIIICEKPLSYEINESKKILELCKSNNAKLFINYFRRTLPGNLKILSLINSKEIRTPFHGTCIYSKGLFNSSSHFINLFEFLFGKVKNIKLINKNKSLSDPEPDFEIGFDEGNIIFISNKNSNIFLNNAELIMQNGKLNFENGGEDIFWKPIIDDKRFSGYKVLAKQPQIIKNDFDRIQFYFTEQLNLAIKGQENFLCNSKEAFDTQKVLHQIKTQL